MNRLASVLATLVLLLGGLTTSGQAQQVQEFPMTATDTVELIRRSIPNRTVFRFFVPPTVIPVMVHDTTVIPITVYDTTVIPITVYDTTRVPVTVYDTTHVEVIVPDSLCDCAPPADTVTVPPPDIVGGTKLERLFALDRTGPLPPKYVDLFNHWGQIQWDRQEARDPGREWEVTYYDRGFGFMGMGLVLGDQIAHDRGVATVLHYRDDYVLPNTPLRNPRWTFPEGITAHALLTGDTESVRAVEGMATGLRFWIDGHEDILDTQYRDGRIQGRAILSQQMAFLLTEDQAYADASQIGVDKLIQWFDAAGSDGRWHSNALPGTNDGSQAYCGGIATFQVAHAILPSLVRHHQLITPVPRLNEILTKTLDHSWGHWVPGQGFRYIQPPPSHTGGTFDCPGSGTNAPAKDLSLLIANAYRTGHTITGLDRFRTMAEEIEAHGLGGSITSPTIFMSGFKQFNQSFFRTWRTIAIPLGSPEAYLPPTPLPMYAPLEVTALLEADGTSCLRWPLTRSLWCVASEVAR